MLTCSNKINTFTVLNRVLSALKKAGVPKEDIEAYTRDAMSKDHLHLLAVSKKVMGKFGLTL